MSNDGQRFDRLPATDEDRDDDEQGGDQASEQDSEHDDDSRATREEVLEFWDERFGIPPETFDDYTFWEKGAGKIWVLRGDVPSPLAIEALGMTFLRTRQEHWKPTTDAVQRFGRLADKCVIDLTPEEARRFLAGEDQEIDWDGDWGYLIAAHEIAGVLEPIGVGLYVYGELRSMVPKGRQREL